MGLATPTNPFIVTSQSKGHNNSHQYSYLQDKQSNSMSQHYHQGNIFSFSNGFERSPQQDQQQQHIAQQIRRDKLRIQGFEPPPALVGIEEEETGQLPVYETETAGMLSEMFSYPSAATATELLENQILQSYRNPRAAPPPEWFQHRQGMVVGDSKNLQTHIINDTPAHHHHHQHQITGINAESAAAMQLFLMNPQQQHEQRSPSPSPSSQRPQVPNNPTSSTLHTLLPNPSSSTPTFQQSAGGAFSHHQFTWPPGNHENNVEGQGLSLSLSSSLQHLEAANKAEELRMSGQGEMLFFGSSPASQYPFKNLQGLNNNTHQFHIGSGSSNTSFGTTMNMLRNSKYAKAAQELLEEFCSVGRGQFKKNKFKKLNNNNGNPTSAGAASGGGGANSSSSSKDVPPLSAADRLEHQRRKVKLLSMLDEVDRRYNHYCEQMQMVVNSFDMVMGFGAAVPYTCLAQKAMSRHFRCLKDAIAAQLKHSCEVLGDKDAGTSGVTKGETPRLRMLEQSLRQQRAFHQMGMMEQEAWRPQRGLPERSVNILRAWLFEHFLHPYPSDADKHLLARQTGLSRNQVSNWFINARVRLWKPMVEEMYQQESKDDDDNKAGPDNDDHLDRDQCTTTTTTSAQTPTPNAATAAITTPRSEINAAPDNDPSFFAINRHHQGAFSSDYNQPNNNNVSMPPPTAVVPPPFPAMQEPAGSTLIRFGTSGGDVSLTLGLRHAGNLPEKNSFSVRDFGGC